MHGLGTQSNPRPPFLISGGADVNARDANGQTLLVKAILANDDEMGVFLIEHDAKAKNDE